MGPQFFLGQPGASPLRVALFWIVFYVWIGGELVIGQWRRAPEGLATEDRSSKWILVSSIWIGTSVGVFAAWLPGSQITIGRGVLFYIGLAMMAIGIAIRWYAIRCLGAFFTTTVMTQPGQRVIDTGPYRWVRHPSYSGSLLTVLGFLICCTNLASLLALVIPIAGFAYRIRVEEAILSRDLGKSYLDYMGRTARLLPFVL